VRERAREDALRAARRVDPGVTGEQILPTHLNVNFVYTRPEGDALLVHWFYRHGHWNERLTGDRLSAVLASRPRPASDPLAGAG
jgi:hypothetical protein